MLDASVVDVVGDELLLHAALENLCKNAIEALGTGGVLKLEWLYDPASHSVLVEVADTGPGIPDSVLTAISRGRPVPSKKAQGSGLGLLSVQHIARMHGGELSIQRANPGTICRLILPVSPIDTTPAKQVVVVEPIEAKKES